MSEARLEGEKVTLEEIAEQDAAQIVKWRSDPRIYSQLFDNRPLTMERHMEWYKGSYLPDHFRTDYMIRDKASGRAVGVVGAQRTEEGPEVSYMIGEVDMTGKGLAKDAIKAVLWHLKSHLGATVAIARILDSNAASIGLVKSLGFVLDSKLEGERPASQYKVKL